MLSQAIRCLAESQGLSFVEEKGGFVLEKVLAERKVFLSRKKLVYRAKCRVAEDSKTLLFTEMLKESGFGLSSGSDDLSPGFGFKKESYKTGFGPREGSIEEQSRLFGKNYSYSFDFAAFRSQVADLARADGYTLQWIFSL